MTARSPEARIVVLVVLDQAVVLGVEDRVDGGQADVLVAAPVAGDEVGVEHLVVVGERIAVVGDQIGGIDRAVAIDVASVRVGISAISGVPDCGRGRRSPAPRDGRCR